MCHQKSVETHYSFIESSCLANLSSLVLLVLCIFSSKQEDAVLWCSGYHVCFTRRRSPVRTRPRPKSALVFFLHMIFPTFLQQLKRFQNIFCMSPSNKNILDGGGILTVLEIVSNTVFSRARQLSNGQRSDRTARWFPI